jgi:RNA-directed DNA polymerase
MTKAPITLQDLRRRLYVKAKAEASWRFWGLYGHVCKRETLREAYRLAKANHGAPGIDGVTFEAVEPEGVEAFLDQRSHHRRGPGSESGNTNRAIEFPTAKWVRFHWVLYGPSVSVFTAICARLRAERLRSA